MSRSRIFLILVLIILLGTVTRFDEIDARSLWEDEGWTLLLSKGSVSNIVQTIAYDQHTPLYFVAVRQWMNVAGDSEFALRAFSAFTGLLSLAAVYQLGRVTFGVQVGIIGALLLAIWDFPVDLSQDARQYTLLLLLVTLSCVGYFRYLKYPSRKNGLLWFGASVLGLYTQYMAGVVLIFQLLHMLVYVRPFPKLRDMIIRWGLICAAFLPWIPVFIRQNQVRWDDPLYYQSGLPNNEATFILIRDALVTKQFGLVVGLFLLGLIAIRYMPRLRIIWRSQPTVVFMGVWAIGYIGLIVWLNESQEILRPRLFIVVIPPILLLVARGLMNLQSAPRLFLLSVLLVVNVTTLDSWETKPPWREVVQNVTEFHQADEPVLMDIWVGDFSARYYVEKQMGADIPWLSLRELRRSAGDFFLPELVGYLENVDSFWLLRWNDDAQEYDDLLAEHSFQRTASLYVDHLGNKLYSYRYDRLTDSRVATFGENIDLMNAEVYGDLSSGQNVSVSLWWVAKEVLSVDYSISVFVVNAASEIINPQDSPPITPTSQWQPNQIQYDPHPYQLPNLPAGDYQIGVRVYWYVEPDQPLAVTSDSEDIAGDNFAVIARFTVE